jgi:DNA-binding transcriptional ArsR family regulator
MLTYVSQSEVPAEVLDAVYTALSNAKRRGMVAALAYHPATVSQLAQEHGLSLPAIHRHIRVLEEARLIQRKKVGRSNFLALSRESLKQAQAWLGQYRTEWGADSETLENYVEHLTKS